MQKKTIVFVLIIAFVLIFGAYYFLNKQNSETEIENNLVGGDKDAHGCIGSAGYSWCEAKQKCIRSWEEYCTTTAPKKVVFACDGSKTITATFYIDDDKFVDLELSDDRKFSVPRSISASGARYTNADETFVFWNKGDTAFITEGADSKETYSNCNLQDTTGLECNDSSKYFAIQKSLSDSVGSDILIKYKTSPSRSFPCVYIVASGDFEIKNVLAEYFMAFTDNFLVLDKGTAPEPRGLVVYDLRSRKIVFTDSYARPVVVSGDSITYLSKTNQKPTLQNCPDLNDYTSNGLGAVIMSKVAVDLSSLDKKDLGVIECRAIQ